MHSSVHIVGNVSPLPPILPVRPCSELLALADPRPLLQRKPNSPHDVLGCRGHVSSSFDALHNCIKKTDHSPNESEVLRLLPGVNIYTNKHPSLEGLST